MWAIDKVFNIPRVEKNDERYYEMLGVQYAQYIKADGEYRFNHYLNRANTIVYRLFLGCGYPYGNMKVLPFEEAFYGGGQTGSGLGKPGRWDRVLMWQKIIIPIMSGTLN